MLKRRKRRKMIPVPITSMGDIAFLLIIFFMVCSNFVKDPGVKITPATTPKVAKLDTYPIVVLVDHESKIYFQGKAIDSAAQIEGEVRAAIGNRTDDKSRTVLFRCDKTVDKSVFEPVIESIAKGGGRFAAVGDKSVNK